MFGCSVPVQFEASHRKQMVEVLFFPSTIGHISIKLNEVINGVPGIYFSHGEIPNNNYEEGTARDETLYQCRPIRILLDLPSEMNPIDIHRMKGRLNKYSSTYSILRNNCADAVLKILKHELEYSLIQNINTHLITTPVYVAKLACFIALEQNKKVCEEAAKNMANSNSNEKEYVSALKQFVQCEKIRIENEIHLLKLNTRFMDWNSANLCFWKPMNTFKKFAVNFTEYSDLKKKETEIRCLKRIETLAIEAEKAETKESPHSYQKLLNGLYVVQHKTSVETAKNLSTCINHFPYIKLHDMQLKKKMDFLSNLQTVIRKNEILFKRQTTFWSKLPSGIDALKKKLEQFTDRNNSLEIQKVFFEIRDILRKKAFEDGANRTDLLQDFYEKMYLASSKACQNSIDISNGQNAIDKSANLMLYA